MMRAALRRRPTDRSRGEEGAISILTAAVLAGLIVATSLAVDVGRVSYVSRDQQGTTDRAALDSLGSLHVGSTAADAYAAAAAALGRNDDSVRTGRYRHITCVAIGHQPADHGAPFQALHIMPSTPPEGFPTGTEDDVTAPTACPSMPGSLDGPVNAVWVNTASFVPFLFAIGDPLGGRSVVRTAVARVDEIGALSVGTTLATVEDGALGALLSALLGGSAGASLVGFQGIVDGEVDLKVLATRLGVGTLEELADIEVTALELIEAVVRALEADGHAIGMDVGTFLGALQPLAANLPPIDLGEILTVATGAGRGAEVAVDAFPLVMAGLMAANKENALTLDVNVLDDLLPVHLTVIEPPQIAVGPPGRDAGNEWNTVARSAQVELGIELPIGQVVGGTAGVVDAETASYIEGRRSYWRNRVDSASSCSGLRTVVRELEGEIEALRGAATELGLLSLLNGVLGLVTNLLNLLANILNSLTCTLGGVPNNMRTDARNLVAEYRDLLSALHGAASSDAAPDGRPTLTVKAATGTAALESIACGIQKDVGVAASASAVTVDLPRTDLLDLGPLGRVRIRAEDAELAPSQTQPLTFTGPPYAPQSIGTTGLGLGGLVGSLDTAGSELLFVPVGGILNQVRSLLSPVLSGVDAAVSPILELLGIELGVAEVHVLDATCNSRSLVRGVTQ